jgi:hypothetical protein
MEKEDVRLKVERKMVAHPDQQVVSNGTIMRYTSERDEQGSYIMTALYDMIRDSFWAQWWKECVNTFCPGAPQTSSLPS